MGRITRPLEGKPGPECMCGSEIKRVPLPADLAASPARTRSGCTCITLTRRCYPDSTHPDDRPATAEPADVDGPPGRGCRRALGLSLRTCRRARGLCRVNERGAVRRACLHRERLALEATETANQPGG